MENGHIDLPLVGGLDHATPTLRRELVFRPQTFGGKACYVVEDPVEGRYFRVGLNEYAFISRMDGKRTIGEALEGTLRAREGCSFTPTDALAICQWLARTGLVRQGEGPARAPCLLAPVAADESALCRSRSRCFIPTPSFTG